MKLVIMQKAKYTSRKKGKDGKWKYTYSTGSVIDQLRSGGTKDNAKNAKAFHKESTKGLLGKNKSETSKELKDATAALSISRAGGNYERFLANKAKMKTMTSLEVATAWQGFKKIKHKMTANEQKAYFALFSHTIATASAKGRAK